ncbi:Hypothetical predicted protein, partial [Paramuricea clavata]
PLSKPLSLNEIKIGITALPSLMPKATCLYSERNVRLQRKGKLSFMEEGPLTSIMEEPQISYVEEPSTGGEIFEEPQLSTSTNFDEQSEGIQCGNCESLLKRNRQLRINWLSAKHKLEICRYQMGSQVESKLRELLAFLFTLHN